MRIREKEIQYYFGKITNDTDKMIQKFTEAYEEPITDFNIEDVDKICESVSTAVATSVGVSMLYRPKKVGRKLKKFTIVEAEPDWLKIPKVECTITTYDFPNCIQDIIDDVPLKRKTAKKGKIQITDCPFAQGSERIAYYGRYLIDDKPKDVVFKEYKYHGMEPARRFEISNQTQAVAAYLARKFTERIGKLIPNWVSNVQIKKKT